MTKAEQTPLDIFIMLDQSSSMDDDSKWTNVTAAIGSFVGQSVPNINVGIQYFGLPPGGGAATCTAFSCGSDADCGDAACGPCFGASAGNPGICEGALSSGGDSCTVGDYATADVAIGAIPGNGAAIVTSMGKHSPSTGTPTQAALQGAIQFVTGYGSAHAGDTVVVVLATDGEPNECGTGDVPGVEMVASAGYAQTPKVPTYVIGVGDDLADLDGIAAAGGTGSAFVVDANANAQAQFLAAMEAIQHTALGCTYAIPQPATGNLDYSKVNVVYTPGNGGAAETIPNVPNAAACPASGNGWYYDNANAPTQIVLCSATCTTVSADTSGEVDISLGCDTIIE